MPTPANDPRWDGEDTPSCPACHTPHLCVEAPATRLVLLTLLGLAAALCAVIGVGIYIALRAILTALGG